MTNCQMMRKKNSCRYKGKGEIGEIIKGAGNNINKLSN